MDAEAIEKYRKAGSIAGRARDYGATLIKPGAKLLEVAETVEKFIRDQGGEPAFPCNVSIGADAAHDTPRANDPRVFEEGMLVRLDCGVHVDGWVGDTAITVEVGTNQYEDLQRASQEALAAALQVVKVGVEIADVSGAIEAAIRGHGYKPIVNLTGHSLDHYHLHAGTSIPNVAATASGRLRAGMAIAIEPFATTGVGKIRDVHGGGIYHFMHNRPVRDPLARKAIEYLLEHHSKLPFAERWLTPVVPADRMNYVMRALERAQAVKQYPVLREIGGGQVAQYEHTVLLLEDGPVVTTLSA